MNAFCMLPPAQGQIHHPLVVAQIEIRLAPVVQHVDLAVLVRAHEASVDVDVRVQFDGRDPKAMAAHQGADGRRRHAFAQGTANAAGDHDVFHALRELRSEGLRRGRRRWRQVPQVSLILKTKEDLTLFFEEFIKQNSFGYLFLALQCFT